MRIHHVLIFVIISMFIFFVFMTCANIIHGVKTKKMCGEAGGIELSLKNSKKICIDTDAILLEELYF